MYHSGYVPGVTMVSMYPGLSWWVCTRGYHGGYVPGVTMVGIYLLLCFQVYQGGYTALPTMVYPTHPGYTPHPPVPVSARLLTVSAGGEE